VAMGLPPAFVTQTLRAQTKGAARRKTLVCVFLRGAVDGLNVVVPFGDRGYYARRRSIAVRPPQRNGGGGALDLAGFFGLHPTRSHFDAQDFMETATPGVKSTPDGWLNRVLAATPCECGGRTLADPAAHAADHAAGQAGVGGNQVVPALRGIAMGSSLPRSLR